MIQAKPTDEPAYKFRGYVYSLLNQKDKALADYNKAIELNPKDAAAYLNRGNLQALQDDLDKARADYTKVVELNADPDTVKQAQGMLSQMKMP